MIHNKPARPGRIIAIGGAEDRSQESKILRRVLGLSEAPNPSVAVITTASSIPDEVFPSYQESFGKLGAGNVAHLDMREREAAFLTENVAIVEASDVLFMSGGDQLRLTHVLGGSPVLEAMRAARARGAVIAGTSAGAAAMSATMIYDGAASDALRKGAVKMAAGLGFIRGVVIDSHFLERGRFTRLMEVACANPEFLGLGLGEDAAVIVHEGDVLEAVGRGHVVVVDADERFGSNIADLYDGEPVALSNLVMHALTSGFGFDVGARRFLRDRDLPSHLEGKRHADTGT